MRGAAGEMERRLGEGREREEATATALCEGDAQAAARLAALGEQLSAVQRKAGEMERQVGEGREREVAGEMRSHLLP